MPHTFACSIRVGDIRVVTTLVVQLHLQCSCGHQEYSMPVCTSVCTLQYMYTLVHMHV